MLTPLKAAWSAETPQTLCEKDPTCPEVVHIPENYGLDNRCTDIADGNPDIVWTIPWAIKPSRSWYSSSAWDVQFTEKIMGHGTVVINTGKRFKPGAFQIQNAYHRMHVEGPSGNWTYKRLGRIEYTVTCGNGLTYRDAYEWEQYDHDCEDQINVDNCSDGDVNWSPMDPQSLDPSTLIIGPELGSKRLRFPVGDVLKTWQGRPVGLPTYYGGPNTLANPVILVNGLGQDFRTMGAVPLTEAGTPEWRKGYVREYVQGSLPDVLSRAYGLAKGDEINRNGIYFLNVDPSVDFENLSEDDKWGYIDRIAEILVDHAQTMPVTASLKADVVCHGTGCLLVRKALEKAAEAAIPRAINPADHIRRIITVNAPHQGTGLAKEASAWTGVPDYKGLTELVNEVSSTQDQVIVDGRVHVDFSDLAAEYCDNNLYIQKAACWVAGQFADATNAWMDVALGDRFLDFPFWIKGTLMGPYTIAYGGQLNYTKTVDGVPEVRDEFVKAREKAVTAQRQLFGDDYVPGRMSEYPRRRDGSYIDVLPFYSENSQSLARAFAKTIASKVEEENPCKDQNGDAGKVCRFLRDYLKTHVSGTLEGMLMGEGSASFGNGTVQMSVVPTFQSMLKNLEAGWLKSSDMVVEAKSQRWGLEAPLNDPETRDEIKELHRPVTYALHYAAVPVGHPQRPVLHTPLMGANGGDQPPSALAAFGTGAPMMGRDLFCGLEPVCADLLSRSRSPIFAGSAVRRVMPILLPSGLIDTREIYTQVVRLQDDFEIYPQILSGEQSGVAIQDGQGNNLAVVTYDPAVGTWIWVAGPNGGTWEVVLSADRRPQFVLKRNGERITLSLVTQEGKSIVREFVTTQLREVDFVALGDGLIDQSVALIGDAHPVDLDLQLPQVDWGSVRPILQERGTQEANQSRPWLWVVNTSGRVLKNLRISYYFTADPALEPMVEMDYPLDLAVTKEYLGGNLWVFHVAIPELPENIAWPKAGMQNRLHYRLYGDWTKSDDPSSGSEMPTFSEAIVIRDALGRILWGTPPEIPASSASVPVAVTATWKDGANANETNMIRPEIVVQNTSAVNLVKGYKVVLRVGGLLPAIVPTLDGYYHPDNEGVISRETDGTLRVEWSFPNRDLEPDQSLGLGEWGIHWEGYESFAKSALSYQVLVLDAAGKTVYTNGAVGPTPSPVSGEAGAPAGEIRLAATWQDAALANERNTIRPDLQIRNLSKGLLSKGWKVKLRIVGMTSEWTVPVLEGDYHPDNTGSIVREAGGSIAVEWTFGNSDLAPLGSIGIGQWRIHWADWQDIPKDELTYSLQIVDAQGNVLLNNDQVVR